MDLMLTPDGDIILEGNDIPRQNVSEFIYQRVINLLRSKRNDWALHPQKGIDITQYAGYPNIPATKDLVEEEVLEGLESDVVLGNLEISVIYTPTAADTAVIEIKVYLPSEDEAIEITEILKSTSSIIGRSTPIFTSAAYDPNTQVTKTEVIELETAKNTIDLKYLPINSLVFILPYSSNIELDENGQMSFQPSVVEQTIVAAEGTLAYDINSTITNILENKLVAQITIKADGIELSTDNYNINSEIITLVGITASSSVFISVIYYDYEAVNAVAELTQESVPGGIFPRSRTSNRYIVATRNALDPGTYFVQYTTYALGG